MTNISDQYNHDTSNIVTTTPVTETVRIADSKLVALEQQVRQQQQEIAQLHRAMTRLKNDVSDIVTALQNRRG